MRVVDVFGLPCHGGSVAAQCRWRVGRTVAEEADGDPIQLGSRVRDAAGHVVLESALRSRPVAPADTEHVIVVPLEVPRAAGMYDVELDSVVEGKFWGSWRGVPPLTLRVERRHDGALDAHDLRSARRYRVAWPPDGRTSFVIPHPLYGAGDSERCVEIPWVLCRYRGERRVLDVGSANAERRYLEALGAVEIPELIGLDLVGVKQSGVRSLVADVRQPALRPGSIDLVIAISVIEHIGRDNSRYLGGRCDALETEGDRVALRTLASLLAPGGRLLFTVPFGAAEDHGWFTQYDAAGLDALVAASGLETAEAEFYRYRGAWEGPLPRERLRDCRYGDGALAASGLACLALSYGAVDRR